MAIECKHGQLARKCDRCEDEQTIAHLESRIAALRAGLERIGGNCWANGHERQVASQLLADDDAKAKGTP